MSTRNVTQMKKTGSLSLSEAVIQVLQNAGPGAFIHQNDLYSMAKKAGMSSVVDKRRFPTRLFRIPEITSPVEHFFALKK